MKRARIVGTGSYLPEKILQKILRCSSRIRQIGGFWKRLRLSDEQCFLNVHKYGNTSGATIPVAMDEAFRAGRVKEGDLVLLAAFGGGFTWGATLIRW